jgi:hypothetical protein
MAPLPFIGTDGETYYLDVTGTGTELDPYKHNQNSSDWYQQVSRGEIAKHSVINKFGAANLSTSVTPVTQTGFYRTPTSATALEIVSDDAADGVGGAGALEVTITGLDSSWNEVSQTIVMNGTTPVAIPTNLFRLYRAFVSLSGTYSSAIASSSHVGEITIRESGVGGDTWSVIANSPVPMGQTQIGVYTVPTGYKAYLLSKSIFVDSTKSVDLFFFFRDKADDVTTPYTGVRRLIERELGVTGGFARRFTSPKGPFVGPCDIGFMGEVSTGTAEVSVEFDLLLIQD